jgi:hypothetical protein
VSQWKIEWHDHGREPQCPPNPDYPDGIDIDIAGNASPACATPLPYPAKRCGYYVVRCKACGMSVAITTAGRPDDPRSVRLPCLRDIKASH